MTEAVEAYIWEKPFSEKAAHTQVDVIALHYLEATGVQKLVGMNMVQEILDTMNIKSQCICACQPRKFW
jgi:hypothetical protein